MASDDTERVIVIESVRQRLRHLILVDQVLDLIHSIGNDQKELIRNKARNESNTAAVDLLINTVIKTPHHDGWFMEFVDALKNGGCQHAADYVEAKFPDPTEEADNDACVLFIQLMSPSLLDRLKTSDVCAHCFSEGIISKEDKENIEAEEKNSGNRKGARALLTRIVRGRPGWFSTFLKVLRDTECWPVYYELTGETQDNGKEDEPAGSDVTAEEGPAGAQAPDNLECLDSSVTEETGDEATVLCEPLLCFTDGTDMAAAGGPKRADIVLRDYQMDAARPALEGKNIIVCLPTGSGKTRVAVYITREHLDSRRREGRSGKVVVLVNKVPLVEQHFSTEFRPFLKHAYKVERVSGDSPLKISFTEIVKKNDVIICTAQILENFLDNKDDEGVQLSDLTLIVIDECHHTKKGEVYNHIMMRYLKQKHKNVQLKKEQKKTVPIPQILGLTASPGVGGATKMDKAEEHILQICANLDAYKIMTKDNGQHKKDPYKQIASVEARQEDPFGDVIKKIMNAIHIHASLSPTCDLGSQNYEQWVVQKERKAVKDEDHKVRVCVEHLRKYNEGLQLSNTIRMWDAFGFLNKYQEEEMKKKVAPEEDEPIQITDTERFLFNLFKENKKELQTLAGQPQFENKSLSELRRIILHEFTSRDSARGIIFTRTRCSAMALSQWIQENSKFSDVGVKASYVIGGGDQSNVKPMTAAEQKDVLNKFRNGEVNLLIATTVAEEGLDIPQCNFVIRYGLVTNEIAMIQAEGRARAEDSSYTLVEVKGSAVAEKESINEYRKDMMSKAIAKIKSLSQDDYDKRIMTLQFQAIMEERVRKTKKKQKDRKSSSPSEVKFTCRGCSSHVCNGDDIQIIENMHRVNVSPHFGKLFIRKENTSLQERLLDYETNVFIACKICGQRWGSMMLFHGLEFPCLHVKNFVVAYNGKKISNCTRWNELAIQFPALDYVHHASQVVTRVEGG
uniref:RNA helicase n=1 Tax=Myripristis murdjan TaxID=586833 RepID=A0A668AZ64_9TELE